MLNQWHHMHEISIVLTTFYIEKKSKIISIGSKKLLFVPKTTYKYVSCLKNESISAVLLYCLHFFLVPLSTILIKSKVSSYKLPNTPIIIISIIIIICFLLVVSPKLLIIILYHTYNYTYQTTVSHSDCERTQKNMTIERHETQGIKICHKLTFYCKYSEAFISSSHYSHVFFLFFCTIPT